MLAHAAHARRRVDRARARRSGRASGRRASRSPPSGRRRARSRTGRACRGGRCRRWAAARVAMPSSSMRATIVLGLGEAVVGVAPHLHLRRRSPRCAPSHTARAVGRERVAQGSRRSAVAASPLIAEPLQLGRRVRPRSARRARRAPRPRRVIAHAEPVLEPRLDRVARARRTSTASPVAHDRDDQLVAVAVAHGAHEPVGRRRRRPSSAISPTASGHTLTPRSFTMLSPRPANGAILPQPAPARALLARVQVRQVHDVVPELRAAGLVELGDADRAQLAVGQRLAGLGIDDLHDERVLEDVQAVVRRALDRHPLHLVEAVRVEALDAERRLEQLAVADVGQRADA